MRGSNIETVPDDKFVKPSPDEEAVFVADVGFATGFSEVEEDDEDDEEATGAEGAGASSSSSSSLSPTANSIKVYFPGIAWKSLWSLQSVPVLSANL
jgi:uncharacterized spore protein YtfJ